MSSPDVSVVLGVRNGGDGLTATLDSILAQRGVAFELIVVDDGSTDATAERLAALAARDARIRLERQPFCGLTMALIRGCALARAPLIARQDADDRSHPDRLRLQRELFDRWPQLVLASCRTLCLGPAGEPLYVEPSRGESAEPGPLLAVGPPRVVAGPSCHGTTMFRAAAYRDAGGYRAEFALAQDWDLWLRLADAGSFFGLPRVLYARALGLGTLSFAFRSLQHEFGRAALEAARLRAAGAGEAEPLARARALSLRMAAERERKGSRGQSEGSYHVGEVLRRRGDRRAEGYLRSARRDPAVALRARIRLAQAKLAPRAEAAAPLEGADWALREPARRPLRILFVADIEPRRDSGAAGSEMEVADELERQGNEVVRVWGDAFPHRIHHWNLYHLLEQPRAIATIVRRQLAAREFDVVHVAQPAGWLAAREHRRRYRPGLFVHRSHGFEPRIGEVCRRWQQIYPEGSRPWPARVAGSLLSRGLDRNYRGIIRFAEGHVVSCGECADYLARRGVPRAAVLVSPLAATADLLATPAPAFDAARARRLLFVGQHHFFKAPMVAAAVFERLLAADPELEATWVCEPEAHDAVRARIGAGVRDRVRLVGWQPRARLVEIYDRHGIFLFPSFTEGFGKVFLEAMARGLAVVATDQGGAHDLVRSGENGLLAPVGDVAALVDGIARLRADPALAAALGREARRTAERRTWRSSVEGLVEFLRRGLAAKGAL